MRPPHFQLTLDFVLLKLKSSWFSQQHSVDSCSFLFCGKSIVCCKTVVHLGMYWLSDNADILRYSHVFIKQANSILWLGLVFLFRLNCSLVIVCLLWLCRNVHCGLLILVWLNNWMWVTVSMARMLRMTAVMFIQVKELRYQSLFVHNFWCFSSLLKLYVSFGLLSLRYIIMLLWCTVELV